ncbi:MAG: CpsD/CapB family tyrosine-protein kinase [Clostridia bacterium]|nr:CpsD/CapB family tyrosine-protein kinase [Clostridia bacterium]
MLFFKRIKQIVFNEKIKSNEQIKTELSLKTIAEIPLKDDKNVVELIVFEKEKSLRVKAFKNLITNVQFLCVNNMTDKKVMLVTSPETKTGKSYVVANMAISFAEIGKKVLIIDADMSNGRQDKIFNVPNNLGLSNYLSNLDSNGIEINEFLSKFINETTIKNVNLITSGTVPPNPEELLSSKRLAEMIKDAKVFFDIIIIDSSELFNKTENLLLAKNVNSTIIVASYNETTMQDLENCKKDIENIGGKVLGVVLNKVKSKKEKKTKEQKKEEFLKLRLKLKEKIHDTIEKIKQKINQSSPKLLEEAKKGDLQKESKNNEDIKANEKIISNSTSENEKGINEKLELKKENTEKENVEKCEESKKIFLIEKLKNIKFPNKDVLKEKIQKTEDNIDVGEKLESNSDKIENENVKIVIDQTVNGETEEKNHIKEKMFFSEALINTKNKILQKVNILKEKIFKTDKLKENNKLENNEKTGNILEENIKQKFSNIYSKCKINCIEKYNYLIAKIKKRNEKEENIEENLKVEPFIEEKKSLEKKEILDDSIKNEKMVLIVIDAENGYCRVFSKEHFTERLVRGVDKKTGYSKAHYSLRNLRRKKDYFLDRYQLTESQVERIDVLVYETLKDYDEYLWIERKMLSDKAENYVLAMSREFEKELGETDKQYKVRCQRLRQIELENAELDIEYKLDNLWKTTKINLFDKLNLSKFARLYEIEKRMKNESEIMKSKKTKKFYSDIILGAEKKLEKANNEERKKEENEKQVIEEDRKIKQEELKLEQQQLEIEKRAAQERIKIEQENVRAEKRAEQERIKEEKRKEREIEKIERKEENFRRKKEKQKQKEEVKFQKEREKLKQREEAKLEEELLVDNLYPKTKNNKNL